VADQTDRSPDIVLAANLVDRLSCAVDYDSADLHHDLLDAPNAATARVVKVVADAERAARIAELRKLLELKDTAIEWGEHNWYVRVDDIEARIAELEAGNA